MVGALKKTDRLFVWGKMETKKGREVCGQEALGHSQLTKCCYSRKNRIWKAGRSDRIGSDELNASHILHKSWLGQKGNDSFPWFQSFLGAEQRVESNGVLLTSTTLDQPSARLGQGNQKPSQSSTMNWNTGNMILVS